MRTLVCLVFISILLLSCQKEKSVLTSQGGDIYFSTDKETYSPSDTLLLTLTNNSENDIEIALRCGLYLEMFYQQKLDGSWSENLWFPFMSLRCPTLTDTVQAMSLYTYPFPADMFDSTGVYRLLLDIYIPSTQRIETLISNDFKIQ
ncbi:MAG: hypothetical protein D6748_08700 [Calditrichaeota bacterium]|nr:MAG: hypothetical protein D6748_08700 [Calditrichota bacterium]